MTYRTRTVVYAAIIGETGLIKIGYTRSISDRLPNLSSAYKSDMTLIALRSGVLKHEKMLHRRLAPARGRLRRRGSERSVEIYRMNHPLIQQFLSDVPDTSRCHVVWPTAKTRRLSLHPTGVSIRRALIDFAEALP